MQSSEQMNIEKARFNMIEQQIRPWNVLDKDILDMLIVVKRENYFPQDQKTLAFFDTELPLPDGSKAMSPKLEARIVQEVNPKTGVRAADRRCIRISGSFACFYVQPCHRAGNIVGAERTC
jgi:hypothetical protein